MTAPFRRVATAGAAASLLALLALAGTACTDDDPAAAPSTTGTVAASSSVPPSSVETATSFTTLVPVETLPPVETPAPTAPDGPVQIDVVVGVDSSPDRIERVSVGESVTVNLTNPNSHDEFHIHGIDLEQNVEAGVMATFNFTADAPGTYEIESHETGDVLVVIVVS